MAEENLNLSYKRIAKNSIILYLRMFLIMGISLYTSRVILKALGVEDFGIYNVVGGFVALFSIISSSLCNAIGRYLNIELGKNDTAQLKKVFSTSINVLLCLAGIIVLLTEVIGIWFIYNKMNLPHDRIPAAFWAFQMSLLTFIITMVSIPYTAVIVAHERMSAFAYISILEAFLKLAVALLIAVSSVDRLILYAALTTLSAAIIRMIYSLYCNRHFIETKYSFLLDKSLLKDMFQFAGWNFVDYGVGTLNIYGIDILVNLFYGVALNASKGIASQVNSAVTKFSQSFMTAVHPQIYKAYAQNRFSDVHRLVFRGSKFSFYMMLLFVIPIVFETKIILELWLVEVPDYAVRFVQWSLITSLIGYLPTTLRTCLYASAKLKTYMIVTGVVNILYIPISYLLLKLFNNPLMIYYSLLFINVALAFINPYIIKSLIDLRYKDYFRFVFLPIIIVTLLSLIPPIALSYFQTDSIFRLVEMCVCCSLSTCFFVYMLGMEQSERESVKGILKKRLHRIRHN